MINDREGLNRKIDQLQNIINFIDSSRQSGTSTLLAKVGATNDCYVIVGDNRSRDYMLTKMQTCDTNKVHSLSIIAQDRMHGQRKPILFDTDALYFITQDFQVICDAINDLQAEIYDIDNELRESEKQKSLLQQSINTTGTAYAEAQQEIIRLQKELINATINKESNLVSKIINKVRGGKSNESKESKEKDC